MSLKRTVIKTIVVLVSIPIILIASIQLFLLLHNIGLLDGYENFIFQRKFTKVINSDLREMKFQDLTDFAWDEMIVSHQFSRSASNDNCYIEKGTDKDYTDVYFYLKKQKIKSYKVRDGMFFQFTVTDDCLKEIILKRDSVMPIAKVNHNGKEVRYIKM